MIWWWMHRRELRGSIHLGTAGAFLVFAALVILAACWLLILFADAPDDDDDDWGEPPLRGST